MGLDMFLNKKTYVQQWDHQSPSERYKIVVTKGDTPVNFKNITYIIEQVGYWRKANQIHKWFVDNVQDGIDDCKEYYVSEDNLKELLEKCKKIIEIAVLEKGSVVNGQTLTTEGPVDITEEGEFIKNKDEIAAILPTSSGFFFGSTGYDQWYMTDIKDTIKILEDCIADPNGEYYYRSSW